MVSVLRNRSPDIKSENTLKAWVSGNLLQDSRDGTSSLLQKNSRRPRRYWNTYNGITVYQQG